MIKTTITNSTFTSSSIVCNDEQTHIDVQYHRLHIHMICIIVIWWNIHTKLVEMYIRALKRQTHKPASFVDTSHKAGDGDDDSGGGDDNDGQKSSNLPSF